MLRLDARPIKIYQVFTIVTTRWRHSRMAHRPSHSKAASNSESVDHLHCSSSPHMITILETVWLDISYEYWFGTQTSTL